MNNCIITGCCLYDEVQERAAWCDLFTISGHYVAHLAGTGATPAWTERAQVNDAVKTLSYSAPFSSNVFEKDRIVIIPKMYATLNEAAIRYIQGDPT